MVDNPNCPEEDGPDYDQASSPLLVDIGEDDTVVVAGQKDGRVCARLANRPEKTVGSEARARKYPGWRALWLAADGATVFVPINDMNDIEGNGQPQNARPGVSAVNAATGEVLWSHVQKRLRRGPTIRDPGVSAAITATEGAVVAGHLDGIE